jgi:hypothetical protein
MKPTNIRRPRFITALALCTLALGIVVFVAAVPRAEMKSPNQTQEAPPSGCVQTSVFGLQTLARNQSLRLSVVNAGLGEPPEPITPGEQPPPDPIHERRVTLVFDIYGSPPPDPVHPSEDGSVRNLRVVRREFRTFMLSPGQGATFEIESTRVGEIVGASVIALPPPDPVMPGELPPPEPVRAAVVTSLEVRQGNSTVLVLPGTTRGFNPQPDPPAQR